jgi:hypothetical protein
MRFPDWINASVSRCPLEEASEQKRTIAEGGSWGLAKTCRYEGRDPLRRHSNCYKPSEMTISGVTIPMSTSEELIQQAKIWPVFAWCLPSLLGLGSFFFSFPIDRTIAFWPRQTIGEIYLQWFLFVTPITTLIAFVLFII